MSARKNSKVTAAAPKKYDNPKILAATKRFSKLYSKNSPAVKTRKIIGDIN